MLQKMSIRFERLSDLAKLPIKGTPNSAAFDLYSAETITVTGRSRSLVGTGLKLLECPADVYLRIAPRSGLGVKGYDIGAGVVDSDYRGHVKVLFINNTCTDYTILPEDRVAQMIPERIRTDVACVIAGEENATNHQFLRDERGECGFGSTDEPEIYRVWFGANILREFSTREETDAYVKEACAHLYVRVTGPGIE